MTITPPDGVTIKVALERFVMACAMPGELGFVRADGTVAGQPQFPPPVVFIQPTDDDDFDLLVTRLAPGKTNTLRTDRYRLTLAWRSATEEGL